MNEMTLTQIDPRLQDTEFLGYVNSNRPLGAIATLRRMGVSFAQAKALTSMAFLDANKPEWA